MGWSAWRRWLIIAAGWRTKARRARRRTKVNGDHRREVALPLTYKGLALETSHRLDLLVEDLVVVELQSVERLEAVHHLQVLTYLRLAGRSTAESSISFVRPSCSSCLRAPATQTGSGPGAGPKSALQS